MHTKLKFRCPNCHVGLNAKAEKAGRSYGCPNCDALVTVPTQGALVPVARPVIVPELVMEDERPRKLARRRKRREKDMVPVSLKMPGPLGHLEAKVDQKTSNMIATTFLGGVLVAIGAVLFSMFGGKSKSA